MNDTTEKYTTPNHFRNLAETNCIAYTDYDPEAGPVYVVEADDEDDAWIQSTRPVAVEP